MSTPDPTHYAWWLASRSAGLVGFVLVAASMILGLAMATGARVPARLRGRSVHEQLALAGLAAIALHGALLLGDSWLRPGIAGILVPFAGPYRPFWTGLGILGGYLAALLGLSFYVRKRLGARRWRSAHRFTPVVYVLTVAHVLGAGSDAATLFLRILVAASAWPIASLLAFRLLAPSRRGARPVPAE